MGISYLLGELGDSSLSSPPRVKEEENFVQAERCAVSALSEFDEGPHDQDAAGSSRPLYSIITIVILSITQALLSLTEKTISYVNFSYLFWASRGEAAHQPAAF
jgi:hypothetical protein